MKQAIRTYSNEGCDVLTAVHMGDALLEHPVKGTTAGVTTVDESKKTLSIKTIQDLISYHSLSYEHSGMRVWKSYGIGQGKSIPYDTIYVNRQGPTGLITTESQEFYDPPAKRKINRNQEARIPTKNKPTRPFECSVVVCEEAFETFAQLQLQLHVSKHNIKKMTQYDEIKREWAFKFALVDANNAKTRYYSCDPNEKQGYQKNSCASSGLRKGWALSKRRTSARFSQKVKDYLTTRLNLGERTGRKADPAQVVLDVRTAKNVSNEHLFNRSEWRTKTQIQGFFSRLAATRHKQPGTLVGLSVDEDDVECLQKDFERQELMEMLNSEMNVSHPICYNRYDLCELHHSDSLRKFDVAMLKTICKHFEIPFKTRDRKQALIDKVSAMVNDCQCLQ